MGWLCKEGIYSLSRYDFLSSLYQCFLCIFHSGFISVAEKGWGKLKLGTLLENLLEAQRLESKV